MNKTADICTQLSDLAHKSHKFKYNVIIIKEIQLQCI